MCTNMYVADNAEPIKTLPPGKKSSQNQIKRAQLGCIIYVKQELIGDKSVRKGCDNVGEEGECFPY